MKAMDRALAGGYSMLELLVVTAIIATLVGIMVPPMFRFVQYVRHLGGN